MAVVRLEGIEKEIYIQNLLSAKDVLLNGLKNDESIKADKWDSKVYGEIINILNFNICPLFYYLQKTVHAYKDNFGKYDQIILSNGGLPEFFSYRQLLEDKKFADQKIREILESEGVEISSKKDLIKKWINEANNNLLFNGIDRNIERNTERNIEKRKYLLNILPDKYQTIEFYEKIKNEDIFDISNPISRLKIKTISKKSHYKKYFVSWFNYLTGFGVWIIYVMELLETFPETNEKILLRFKKFLEDHMTSGAFFLAREMDKSFETLYPNRISTFQFGPMLLDGICDNLSLSMLFSENPGTYFLTAIREDIANGGLRKKDDAIDKMIGTKCIWRSETLKEERFGVCSKELEVPLKDYVKFPNMRFYIV